MKKMILLIMAVILLLGTAVPAAAAPTPEQALQDARIYSVGDLLRLLNYNGSTQVVAMLFYTGTSIAGESFEYPAYCINPEKPGPYLTGAYSVDTKAYISDPKVWGIISNGYPYKTIGELGLQTREQAFYATKMALYTYINNWNVNLWTANPGQNATLTALGNIYNAGMAVTEIERPTLTATPESQTMELDALNPSFASQTYTLTANMDIRSYEVFLGGNIPDGTRITDMNNNPKTVFSAGEKFKILIPANQISGQTGNFEVTVASQMRTNAVIYGMSYDTAVQDFAITRDPFGLQNAKANVLYSSQNTFLEIIKLSAGTNMPLSGAVFKVTESEGGVLGTFTTDSSGHILVPLTKSGAYQVEEITPPSGFTLDKTPHKDVVVSWGQTTTVTFSNEKEPNLTIQKIDALTGVGISDTVIRIAKEGGMAFTDVKTGAGGFAHISLPPGVYSATEISVPMPYTLDSTPQTIILEAGKNAAITFKNTKKPGLIIWKYDEDTGTVLARAQFSVAKKGGAIVYEGITDSLGMIHLENLEPNQWYTVTELTAPKGYLKRWEEKDVYLEAGKTVEVKFDNRLRPALRILKVDSKTNEPLAGAKFYVKKTEDATVSEYITDATGTITIYDLDEAIYSVWEFEAPDNYLLDSRHKDILLEWGKIKTLVFTNKAKPQLEILKIDEISGKPLQGATFKVWETGTGAITEYVTDANGRILISGLEDKTYSVEEIVAPRGYLLEPQHKDVKLQWGEKTTLTFTNKPLPWLTIIKLDSVTRQPIEGAEFSITKMSGEKVENELRGYTFRTDKSGQIFTPFLEDGHYIVKEEKAAEGYILDAEPHIVHIQAGKPTLLEVLNTPVSGLLIVKTDEKTGKPLADVQFDVRRADGQFVSGNILDGNQPDTPINSPNHTASENGNVTGSYTTDANGRILINNLPAAEYHVIERRALDGYELDTNVYSATVTLGKLTTLNLTNRQKAGLRLIKIDSISKKGIYNVEFMVFDADKKVVGTYYTDDKGVIDFVGILPDGRYTIRETRPAPSYYIDDVPRTIELKSGQVTEIIWENTPEMGQIQIFKKSGDDNEVNGLFAGTPLSDAVFEAYEYKSGNLVDRFVSGVDGRAVSRPLPLGRYIVKEVQSPKWYKLSAQELDIEIEFATQIIKQEFLNYSANTGVQIRKTGNYEAMPGDTISYYIRAVRNDGTVPLTDFYWRDVLPVDAVRLTKIVTGTYNQSLRYKVMITTNKGDSRIIADNLSTMQNNVINCSNASLGLRSDEYVTSFTLMFGTVKAGFSQVEQPRIFVRTLNALPNGYEFANKADVGGKYGSEWVVSNSTWLTKIYSKPEKLPRTGF